MLFSLKIVLFLREIPLLILITNSIICEAKSRVITDQTTILIVFSYGSGRLKAVFGGGEQNRKN